MDKTLALPWNSFLHNSLESMGYFFYLKGANNNKTQIMTSPIFGIQKAPKKRSIQHENIKEIKENAVKSWQGGRNLKKSGKKKKEEDRML